MVSNNISFNELEPKDRFLINEVMGYDFIPVQNSSSELEKEVNAWFSQIVNHSTSFFFFLLIVSQFIAVTLFANPTENSGTYIISVVKITFGFIAILLTLKISLIPRFLLLFKSTDYFGNQFTKLIIWLSKDRNSLKRLLYWLLKSATSIKPFRFQNVWWWTLIISIVTANSEYIKKNPSLSLGTNNIDQQAFFDYTVSLSKGLIISIIAYIASNIIRELLSLRGKYEDTYKQVENLSNTVNANEIKVKHHYDKIDALFSHQDIGVAMATLNTKIIQSKINASLKSSFDVFYLSIKNQVDNIADKLSISDPIINFWLISALGSYANIEAEKFKREGKIITNYKIFAKFLEATIVRLMEDKDGSTINEIEIYTICVLSPERYLNYKELPEKTEDVPVRYSDEDWNEYLKIIKKARDNVTPINTFRHFISLNATPEVFKKLKETYGLDELASLKSNVVKEELELYFFYNGTELLKIPKNGNHQYLCNKYLSIEEFEQEKLEQASYSTMKLKDILNKVYHSEGFCKMLEVKIEESDMDLLDGLILDKKTKKPIDYYAIKRKKTSTKPAEWLISFKGPYDKTFDAIELQILSKADKTKEQEWCEEIKRLDQIFGSNLNKNLTLNDIDKYIF